MRHFRGGETNHPGTTIKRWESLPGSISLFGSRWKEAERGKESVLTGRRLTSFQQLSFGLLSFPISLAVVSVLTFVPTYYAIDLGIGLTAAGLIFAAGRILDVLTDPLIGHVSDETRSPLGKRLPWMIFGALILGPTLYGVMAPSDDVSLMMLALLVALFFTGLTLIDLPYSAVGLEISPFIHERTVLASVKAAFQIVGALGASALILAFASDQAFALELTAILVIFFILVGLIGFWGPTPFQNQQEASFTRAVSVGFSPKKAINKLRRNSDYKRLLLAFGLAQAGSATSVGLTALLVTKQIGATELTGGFIGVLLIFTAIALPFWFYLSKRYGKAESWQLGLLLGSALMMSSFLFTGGNLWLFGLFCALFGFVVAGDVILPTTLLADIVSDEPSEPGHNQAGAMLGFKNAVSKLGFVVPMLIAFPILGALGVEDAETLSGVQAFALLALYGGVPAVLRLGAWWTLRSTPSIHASKAVS